MYFTTQANMQAAMTNQHQNQNKKYTVTTITTGPTVPKVPDGPLTEEQVQKYIKCLKTRVDLNNLLRKEEIKLQEHAVKYNQIVNKLVDYFQCYCGPGRVPFLIERSTALDNTDNLLRAQATHNKMIRSIGLCKKKIAQHEIENADVHNIIQSKYASYMKNIGEDYFGTCQICLDVQVPTKIACRHLSCMVPDQEGNIACPVTICLDCAQRYTENETEIKCILCRKEYSVQCSVVFHVDYEKMRMIQRKIDQTWETFLQVNNIRPEFITPFNCTKCTLGFNNIFEMARHKLGEGGCPCLKVWKQCKMQMCTNSVRISDCTNVCDEHESSLDSDEY
jgi:hypothetical protein